MNERTEFRENQTKGNVYDDILTVVIRFMGGLLPQIYRRFFFKLFPPRFGRGKKRNTSNSFFIETKWKLPKKPKTKKCGSKPP